MSTRLSVFTRHQPTDAFKGEERAAPADNVIQLKGKHTPPPPKNWFTKDPEKDGVEGASIDRVYSELGLKIGVQPIVVAVIDSGFDLEHEDLRGRVWTNPGEIAGNGMDNDGNGYIGDIHGWNFLGSVDKNGKPINIEQTTLEVTREYRRLNELNSGAKLSPEQKKYFRRVKADFEGQIKNTQKSLRKAQTALAKTKDRAKRLELRLEIKNLRERLKTKLNPEFDPRAEIIGDDPANFRHRFYGNSDVQGPNPRHGTHVAGIIAAMRGNGLGTDGVATDVRIMPIRAVPDGDEYDKDVANAIRYAVDNGAAIINMSFGKSYSPYKAAVDEAINYAQQHGVLIFHAAGNDHSDNDKKPHYPDGRIGNSDKRFSNWLEIGASSPLRGIELAAPFSNYGKKSVDLFAPGVKVDAPVPAKNKYAALSGTSMATPTAAGIAALILSQYPNLRAEELKSLLSDTARKYPDLKVRLPRGRKAKRQILVPFSSLSITGGIVSAYNAFKRLRTLHSDLRAAA